jgi:hypothetical protein
VPGALPATPAASGRATNPSPRPPRSATSPAGELVSGRWPGAPVSGQPIPAALPATAAALLHVTDGDVLRMRTGSPRATVRFVVTGLYRPRQLSSPYWGLDDIALSGSSTAAASPPTAR